MRTRNGGARAGRAAPDADGEGELGLRLHIEALLRLGLALQADEVTLLVPVLLRRARSGASGRAGPAAQARAATAGPGKERPPAGRSR